MTNLGNERKKAERKWVSMDAMDDIKWVSMDAMDAMDVRGCVDGMR
jgi:hypothetical protein